MTENIADTLSRLSNEDKDASMKLLADELRRANENLEMKTKSLEKLERVHEELVFDYETTMEEEARKCDEIHRLEQKLEVALNFIKVLMEG